MIDTTENIYHDASLIRKALLDDITEAEASELKKLLEEKPELSKLYIQLQEGDSLKALLDEYEKYSAKEAYQLFLQRIYAKKPQARRSRVLYWCYSVAAILVLAIGISFWVMNSDTDVEPETHQLAVIAPGMQKGQLVLPDGNVVDVNKKDVDIVVNGVSVKYKKGVLSYEVKEKSGEDILDETVPEYNKLVIPRGGENTVVLSDGTVVRLNSGSKLTYPVKFAGKVRAVALEGEAYFDVVKDVKHQFVVQTRFGNVAVLGTAFNVNAYNDEKSCYTTLVRGTVSFATKDNKEIRLQPGEQAIASSDGVDKKQVDLEEYVGWVNGVYLFKNKPLGDIMNTFAKWYDISVYYETPSLRNTTYSGNLKRYDSINSFLDALVLTGDLEYKVNGKNILIYNNKEKD